MIPMCSVISFRLFRYYTVYDWAVLSLELLVVVYMVGWAYLEGKR